MFRLRDVGLVVVGALATFAVGAGLLLAWRPAWSSPHDLSLTPPPVVVGRVASLRGTLQRAHGTLWSTAARGDALLLGTSLRTEADTEAWLVFTNGSQLRLDAGSELTLLKDGAKLTRGAVRAFSTDTALRVHGSDGSLVTVNGGPIEVLARDVAPEGGADALTATSVCGEASVVSADGANVTLVKPPVPREERATRTARSRR